MKALKLTCPNCQYQTDFMSALQDTQQREFMRRLVSEVPTGQHVLLMRYLNMFKPLQYAMSFSAMNTRLEELLALIKSGRVMRNRDTRAAPMEMWLASIETLVNNKPDSLGLPLKSHAYLRSMVWNEAESAAAAFETAQIEHKRTGAHRIAESDSPKEQDPVEIAQHLEKFKAALKTTNPQEVDNG